MVKLKQRKLLLAFNSTPLKWRKVLIMLNDIV